MRDRVDGNSDLRLHLAAHQCDKETAVLHIETHIL